MSLAPLGSFYVFGKFQQVFIADQERDISEVSSLVYFVLTWCGEIVASFAENSGQVVSEIPSCQIHSLYGMRQGVT